MEMLNPDVMHQLFTHSRPVMTKAHDTPPAKYSSGSNATNSFISAGCRIDGTVRGSTLSRDVVVESGAYVANSIIMQAASSNAAPAWRTRSWTRTTSSRRVPS